MVVLIVLALSELQTVRCNDKLTTLFLPDVSQSVPQTRQRYMLEYLQGAVKTRKSPDDLAGVIVLGKESKVEVPPTPQFPTMLGIENTVDAEYTDLASAIKLALATSPEDTARRIVILSGGDENRGNAIEQALVARCLKVQADVLPVEYRYDREVLVEKVAMSADVKVGETVNINVFVRAAGPTTRSLQVFQRTKNYRAPSTDDKPDQIALERGVNVFSLKKTVTEPKFCTFEAEFIPDEGSGDVRALNNRVNGFARVRSKAKVLLIESTRDEQNTPSWSRPCVRRRSTLTCWSRPMSRPAESSTATSCRPT